MKINFAVSKIVLTFTSTNFKSITYYKVSSLTYSSENAQ